MSDVWRILPLAMSPSTGTSGWAWRWVALKWWSSTSVAGVLRVGTSNGWHVHVGLHRPTKDLPSRRRPRSGESR